MKNYSFCTKNGQQCYRANVVLNIYETPRNTNILLQNLGPDLGTSFDYYLFLKFNEDPPCHYSLEGTVWYTNQDSLDKLLDYWEQENGEAYAISLLSQIQWYNECRQDSIQKIAPEEIEHNDS